MTWSRRSFLLSAVALAGCGGDDGGPYVYSSDPPVERAEPAHFGYYLTMGDQINETRGEVNAQWIQAEPDNWEHTFTLLASGAPWAVLDIAGLLFANYGRFSNRCAPGAASTLAAFFQQARVNGTIGRIRCVVPIDEPNLTTTPDDLALALDAIDTAAAQFAELSGLGRGVIYADMRGFGVHASRFDYLGVDNYGQGAGILNPGRAIDRLRQTKRADAMLWLVPGGSYGQDPAPFVDYVQTHADVDGMWPFLWADAVDEGTRIPGIRGNGMAAAYRAAGAELIA